MDGAEADYTRKWFVLAAVGMGIFLSTIDGSIVNIALPTLADEFDVEFAVVQWVVLAYLLVLASLIVTIGRWGDMIGKKGIYTVGFGVFTVGSVLCGLSPGVYWLVGFRAMQGVGAAMVAALGLAILTEAFPPWERGKALGIGGSVVSVGIVIGPTLGGLLIESLGWRWIFFVNLPIGILGTWMAVRFVPDTRPPGGQRFDLAGAVAFFLMLLTLSLGLSLGLEVGFASPPILGLFVVAAISLVAFVVIERRVAQPMVDLAMFRNPDFTVGLATGLLSFAALIGMYITAPFYLSDTLGFSPATVGLLLASVAVTIGVVAPISGRMSDRIGPRPVTVVGLAVIVLGYALLRGAGTDTTAAAFVGMVVWIGMGMGIFQSPNNSAILGSVIPERLGVAGSMLGLNRIVGQLIGVAALSTFWAARLETRSMTQSELEAGAGAFRDVTAVGGIIVLFGLLLAVWAYRRERNPSATR